MQVDANTKDVFREMDGFLILMSVLSTSAFSPSENPAIAFERGLQVFSAATHDHAVNLSHFKVRSFRHLIIAAIDWLHSVT
jgi:hypothetical protein